MTFPEKQKYWMNIMNRRQVLSVIHSTKPTVVEVANIVFTWKLFCFEKVGTDGRHVKKTMITTGRDYGLA